MYGLPKELKTKQDWLNAVNYAVATGDGKAIMTNRLKELKMNTKYLVLKKESEGKPPEEQTPDDFEFADDPACEKNLLDFSDQEINNLIGELK